MRAFNVLSILFVLFVGVIFAVRPGLTCNPNACRNRCVAKGATGGICQSDRSGAITCMCSYNPVTTPPCDADICRDDCIANSGATGGICQTERSGAITCMCSFV